ncbi:MAG: hypothetical protein PWP08_1623 [Methanofollis sp.]|nr:hypothetical protein [Methanofollis sp.]
MERQDLISIGAAIVIVLVLALVIKPALTGGSADNGSGTLSPAAPWQPEATPTPPAASEDATMIERDYRWTGIDGGVHTMTVSIPENLFAYYRNMSRIPYASAWGRYALSEEDRPYLETLIKAVTSDHAGTPDDDYYRVMDVIFFVQQLPYASDNSAASYYEGVLPPQYNNGEYPKYPVETLIDGKGDCEDTSILAAAMLDLMGYDVVLLRFSDHMALGMEMTKFTSFYADYPPKYYDYEGKQYYYVETTNYIEILRIVELESDDTIVVPERWGRPWSIGDTADVKIASVRTEKPEIIPLRYVVRPRYHTIYPVLSLPGTSFEVWPA